MERKTRTSTRELWHQMRCQTIRHLAAVVVLAGLALQGCGGIEDFDAESFSQDDIDAVESDLTHGVPTAVGAFEAVGRIPGCTATLVTDRAVLTAAHCVCPSDFNTTGCGTRTTFTMTNVRPVDNPWTSVDESATRRDVSLTGDVIVHPDFGAKGWLRDDYAIVILDRSAKSAALVSPIPVEHPDRIPRSGDRFTLVGYGPTGTACNTNSGKTSMSINVDNVNSEALWFQDARRVCPGDSGGPALNTNGKVAGVTSWRDGSSSTYRPTHSRYAWIIKTLGQFVSSGSSNDLDRYRAPYGYSLPVSGTAGDIIGVGIAGSSDQVFAWYRDGRVTRGMTQNLDLYRLPYGFTLPPGKYTWDIVGMGIAGSNDMVYTWYRDGTVSAGTSWDLDAYKAPYRFSLPPGKSPADIIGMGIAGSSDWVFAWYKDGTVSAGTSNDLDRYRAPYRVSLPSGRRPEEVKELAISRGDKVYVWFEAFE